MKKILLVIGLIISITPPLFAAKSTYIVTNHRLNYVKLSEVKGKVAQSRMMTHPKELDEAKMREVLGSVKISKRQVIGDDTTDRSVFNDKAIDFLAPALVRAFRKATPLEEVVFSYLVKDPIFIIRNDRLNIAELWVHDDELHIKFGKLYAKVLGDIDKKGNYSQIIAKAKGLRVEFELGPGQTLNPDDTDELIIALNYNSGNFTGSVKPSVKDSTDPNIEERLKTLDDLKKKKLISDTEYKEKRKEILGDF